MENDVFDLINLAEMAPNAGMTRLVLKATLDSVPDSSCM